MRWLTKEQEKIVVSVRVYYEDVPQYALNGGQWLEGSCLLRIMTVYGIIWGTIALSESGDMNEWQVWLTTEFPKSAKAPAKVHNDRFSPDRGPLDLIGLHQAQGPRGIVWDWQTNMVTYLDDYRETQMREKREFPLIMGKITKKEFAESRTFVIPVAHQIIRELHELDVIKEGAVLGLLKYKHNLGEVNRTTEEIEQLGEKVRQKIEEFFVEDRRDGILKHQDKGIRLEGMGLLSQRFAQKEAKKGQEEPKLRRRGI